MTGTGLIDASPGRAFHQAGGVPKVTVLRIVDIDDDDVMAGALGLGDPLRDALDAGGVRDGGAAVLLHDQSHVGNFRRAGLDDRRV